MRIHITRIGTIALLLLIIITLYISAFLADWIPCDEYQPVPIINSSTLVRSREGVKGQLRVAIAPSAGFIGGLMANKGFTPVKDSIYMRDYSLQVVFTVIEDNMKLIKALNNDEIDVIWSSTASLPFYSRELCSGNATAFFHYAWSYGEEVLIVNKNIADLQDLNNKSLAASRGSAAHLFSCYLLEQSGITQDSLDINLTATDTDALLLFKKGRVDACVVNTALIDRYLKKDTPYRILASTRDFNNLIAGIFVTKESFIVHSKGRLVKFASGWFDGLKKVRNRPVMAAKQLAGYFNMDQDSVNNLLGRVYLSGPADNLFFFGITGNSQTRFNDLYEISGQLYKKGGFPIVYPSANMVKNTAIMIDILKTKPQFKRNAGGVLIKTELPSMLLRKKSILFADSKPLYFTSESFDLSFEAKNIIAEIAQRAAIFGKSTVFIQGYNNSGKGDTLSYINKVRAEMIKNHMIRTHRLPYNRIHISTETLPAKGDTKNGSLLIQLKSSEKM